MWTKTKDAYHNLRRHKIMVALILVLGFICYRMFVSNYIIQNPIIKKDNYEDPLVLHNEYAACSQNLDQAMAAKDAAIMAGNPDLNK